MASSLPPHLFSGDGFSPPNAIASLSSELTFCYVFTENGAWWSKERPVGVESRMFIARGFEFGPLLGLASRLSKVSTFVVSTERHGYWSLCLEDDDYANWMKYIRISHEPHSYNLEAYQKNNSIYFVTNKDIQAGEKLVVSYSAEYFCQMSAFLPAVPSRSLRPQQAVFLVEDSQLHPEAPTAALNSGCSMDALIMRLGKSGEALPSAPMEHETETQPALLETVVESIVQDWNWRPDPTSAPQQDRLSSSGIRKGVVPVSPPAEYSSRRKFAEPPNSKVVCMAADSSAVLPETDPASTVIPIEFELPIVWPSSEDDDSPWDGDEEKEASDDESTSSVFTAAKRITTKRRQQLDRRNALQKMARDKRRPFVCTQPNCTRAFAFQKKRDIHSKVKHKRSIYCPFCKKDVYGQGHIENVHGQNWADFSPTAVTCHWCPTKCSSSITLRTHCEAHHAVNGHYPCPTCPKTSANWPKFVQHLKRTHGPVKRRKVQCEICGILVRNLTDHRKIHSPDFHYKCDQCGQQFKFKDYLKKHVMAFHTADKPNPQVKRKANVHDGKKVPRFSQDYLAYTYKCVPCKLGFRRKSQLAKHLEARHPELPAASIPELDMPMIEAQRFQCPICKRTLQTKPGLLEHVSNRHTDATVSDSDDGPVKINGIPVQMKSKLLPWCVPCDMKFESEARLLSHNKHWHK